MDRLGHQVKKLVWQNKYTLNEIARICNSTIEECTEAYENFMGHRLPATFLLACSETQKKEFIKLILQRNKILLFGNNGIGKSSLPRLIAKELGWRLVSSHPRNNEDLLRDFGELPLKTKNTIFVIEGDSFYWRSYALINHYIKESKNPIIIIVDKKDTVHGSVAKQLINFKLLPPSKKDVEIFLRKKFPSWKGDINDVYDSDMRITLRKVKFGLERWKPSEKESINSQQLAYNILNGKATDEQFDNCSDGYATLLFTNNWLGFNFHTFYDSMRIMDNISFIDSYKYNYKKVYLKGMLLGLPNASKRGKMIFPTPKFKPPKEDEDEWEHKKIKKRKKEIKKQKTITKFTGDMEL